MGNPSLVRLAGDAGPGEGWTREHLAQQRLERLERVAVVLGIE
jgi:hypothetical protein